MGFFEGKKCVVTGGAQGIGLGCCKALASSGAKVFAVDRDEEALEELAANFSPLVCDLSDPRAVEGVCERIGAPVDVLVNNAGISGEWRGILETSVEEWDRVLNLNLRAYWLMAKYLVPKMPQGAAIVNIASTRALMSEANSEPYSASKGGIVALTHSLAISLADRHIRVNCISPGWIDVRGAKKGSARDDCELSARAHEQHPVGRVGTPDDVAEACLYLASAGFVTGANLIVDGGMTRKMIYEE